MTKNKTQNKADILVKQGEMLLPQNLSNEDLESLLQEANNLQNNKDSLLVNLTQNVLLLAGFIGRDKISHEDLSDAVALYLRYLGLEKLKRLGVIVEYETINSKDLFDYNKKDIAIKYHIN